jgi:5-methylthioribose kinase
LPGLEVFLPVQCTSRDVQTVLDESNVFEYLRGRGLIGPEEPADQEPAGDGNINWVRRIRSARSGRSWIVKQARPALERFPEYEVTTERIVFEARYFEVTGPFDAERVRPAVLHFDPEQRVLVLEDLGNAERLDAALGRGADVAAELARLATFLGAVHAGTCDGALAARFRNGEMQRLDGDHIFALPYRQNDFPLSPALSDRARAIWNDADLVATIDAAYARYLEPHGALVHADVQSGNVLLAERGAVPLDAEIAHVGDPAFDVGVLLAHLWLPAIARGDRPSGDALARKTWKAYAAAHGATGLPRYADVARYAGVELLRRTIGAARVAAVERDEAGLAVLDAALGLVREPPRAA